jgi:hypothetical protein
MGVLVVFVAEVAGVVTDVRLLAEDPAQAAKPKAATTRNAANNKYVALCLFPVVCIG